MTPEQEAMFAVHSTLTPETQPGQEDQMTPDQAVGQGMGMAWKHMKDNGPAHATHLVKAKQMTKAQYEEQVMREKQGLPSSPDEAMRVQSLEARVDQIDQGINKILSHLTNPGGATPSPAQNHCATAERVPPDEQPLRYNRQGEVVPPAQPSPQPTPQPELLPPPRTVTLKSGKVVAIPSTPKRAMGLGPAGDEGTATPPEREEYTVPKGHPLSGKSPSDLEVGVPGAGSGEALWENEAPAIASPIEVPEEAPAEDPQLVQLQVLVQHTVEFLRSKDPHRMWRKALATHLHRHVGYSGWDQALQVDFNRRFQGFLSDSQFVTSICRKVLNMELGAAVGVEWVAAMVVMAAGWTAFVMSGLDN